MSDLGDVFEQLRDQAGAVSHRPKAKKRRRPPPRNNIVQFPLRVDLEEHERRIVAATAKVRFAHDRQAGINDRRVQADLHGWRRDLLGFAGEYVFGKGTGTKVDFTTVPRSGGVDATLASGLTVDVKSTDLPTGRLICPLKDQDKLSADLFVLVTVAFPLTKDARLRLDQPAYGIIQGWAWAEDMLDKRAITGLKKSDNGDIVDTYVINNSQLHRTLSLNYPPTREDYPCIHDAVSDPAVSNLFS